MKAVPSLTNEPPGLAAWRAEHAADDHATGGDAKNAWTRFRDSGHAYSELLQALLSRQQGLCGYCEQRLSKSDGTLVVNDHQIEHVSPKSGGPGRVLAWRNMMLCCGGGTWRHHRDATRHLPDMGSRATVSCGQAKGDATLDGTCDPRALDWHEPVIEVGLDGSMRANEAACRRAGIDPQGLDATIAMLELNCERLKRARRSVADHIRNWVVQLWEEGRSVSPNLTEAEASEVLRIHIGGRLRPDAHGHLQPFWTTERLHLGPPAEAWIRENAKPLHFE